MQLIGMLDSTSMRRAAVSLQLLGLPFEHRSISVICGFAQFAVSRSSRRSTRSSRRRRWSATTARS